MVPKPLVGTVRKLIDVFGNNLACNGCNDWDFTPEEHEAARKYLGNQDVSNTDYTVLDIIKKALGI